MQNEQQRRAASPRNVVVVLLDSLNRHHLGCYGGREFATPNLDRFARDHATRFTRHVTGSLPCMPARHIRANDGAKLSMIDHWLGEIRISSSVSV